MVEAKATDLQEDPRESSQRSGMGIEPTLDGTTAQHRF